MEKLTLLMAERDPLYRGIADIIVSTEARNTQAVVQDIRGSYEKIKH
jgi:shikimate kinase